MMQYQPLEQLREQFECSAQANALRLQFKEYAILYRYFEGSRGLAINDSLFMSSTTLYRCKKAIVRKLKATSFHQALIFAGMRLFGAATNALPIFSEKGT